MSVLILFIYLFRTRPELDIDENNGLVFSEIAVYHDGEYVCTAANSAGMYMKGAF